MRDLSTETGQAMVEAAMTLGFLFLLFVCIYSLFVMAITKLRALDRSAHAARVPTREPFLFRSWPGAPLDRSPSAAFLLQETVYVVAKAHLPQSALLDAADDVSASREAEVR